jgi:hypothetical protein
MGALEEMRGSPYNQGNPQFILWTPDPRGLRQEIIRGDLVCLTACLARRGSIELASVALNIRQHQSYINAAGHPDANKS